ncbi:MFS transporter [Glutamicibacter arilaitensis]|uniref:MFS transporter n=1 Tax=Glutamicibacter arilaitensis TaxID=256701 RepID=UPI001D027C86|nr:MFS transporter [Glutamicibacter arilaitensis]
MKTTRAAKAPIPQEISVLLVAAFIIALGFGLIAPILPQYAVSFDVGNAAATIIVSIFAFTRLIFAPVAGVLVGKLGEPKIYVTGVLLVAVSTLLCAVVQDYTQLLIARGLGGFGSTMFTISAMALIARLAPEESRGRISGLYAGSFLLGNVAGPVLGTLLAPLGMRLPFLIYGAALILAAMVVHLALGRRRSPDRTSETSTKNARRRIEVVTMRQAVASPTYRAALFSGFSYGWLAFGVRNSMIPLFALALFGQREGQSVAGASLAIFAMGNGAALLFSGKLTDRIGRRVPVLIGMSVLFVSIGAMGLVTSWAGFMICSAIAGLGAGTLGPAQQAAVADVIGSGKNGGKALAGFQMCTDLGSIIGPLVAGAFADLWSYQLAFGISAIVGLVGVIAWLLAPHPRKYPKAEEDSCSSIA